MPSSPESGPTRMSAPSCSTRRRVSSIALSAVSSAQPYPTTSMFFPATLAPVTPSRRLLAGGLRTGLVDQRLVEAGGRRLEEGAERALAVGQEPDLDRTAASTAVLGGSIAAASVVVVVVATRGDESASTSMAPISASNRLLLTCPPPLFASTFLTPFSWCRRRRHRPVMGSRPRRAVPVFASRGTLVPAPRAQRVRPAKAARSPGRPPRGWC